MKKIMKKAVSLFMAGAMVIMPVSMSAQAKEIGSEINKVSASSTKFVPNAKIKGNGVRIRKGTSTTSEILGLLYDGDKIQTLSEAFPSNGMWWRYCQTETGIKGYIVTTYISFT